ncbi:MAG TPA: immunity 26/phosphotriesterase HocA family protein [Microlunatus sp.]|nr:immunity 26/phosphotriesterase HocA family protein [Microlunatus sp.]
MAQERTNLQVINRSRTMPREGDVFAMLLPDSRYLFGQVVGADLPVTMAPMEGSYLIYIYREVAETGNPDLDRLTPDTLLLAPSYINRMPWTKGYFRNVAHRPLKPEHLLQQHCFWDPVRNHHHDGHRRTLTRPVEPCGRFVLMSYRRLDDLISDALDIARAPDDEAEGDGSGEQHAASW